MSSPTETLILRAASLLKEPLVWALPEPCAALKNFRSLAAVQSFRPDFLGLQRLGIGVQEAWPEATAAAIALTLPRQVEWACGLMAQALERLAPGGTLAVTARNDRGGKRYAALLEEHFGLAFSDSKNHCRLAAVERPEKLPPIIATWTAQYQPRIVPGTPLLALPGTFSWNEIDKGSALLARHLPPLSGRVADFGAGWGYLSHVLLDRWPGMSRVDLYDADLNALNLARRNLSAWPAKTGFFWHDLLSEACTQDYDAIVMNPPFHALRDTDVDIGRGFIAAAARALKAGGALWMVANRHLPYEEALASSFREWKQAADEDGFKILTATR